MSITSREAKKLVTDRLLELGYKGKKLTARTVSFTDLARANVVFVSIWNFFSYPDHASSDCSDCVRERRDWEYLKKMAFSKGFRIRAENTPRGS